MVLVQIISHFQGELDKDVYSAADDRRPQMIPRPEMILNRK